MLKGLGLSHYYLNVCAHAGRLGRFAAYVYKYKNIRGHFPNLLHPQDLSEHILSSLLKRDFRKYARFADKVLVREYVKSKGLGDHLLDIYGVWETAKDINFDLLPQKFALKANNGCGGHFICYDKESIRDIDSLKKQLDDRLKLGNQFAFEPHYRFIKPNLYAEELIETEDKKAPTDYKFMCIKGKIADCLVVPERENDTHKCIRYDINWNVLPYTNSFFESTKKVSKPKHWEEMKKIASILSEDFECVRVDLYEYKDKVYFGELTFSPAGGILPTYNNYGVEEIGKLF